MSYRYIQVEKVKGVLVLRMHDPGTRNALGEEMAGEMLRELDRFEDDPEGRLLLLTGTEPSFCSGANVKQLRLETPEREKAAETAAPIPSTGKLWDRLDANIREGPVTDKVLASVVPLRIYELQKPSLAAVNGHAMGVGMGLAVACDLRIASEKAVFSEAFVNIGLVPGDGSCWQLPRLIGLTNTFMLQYTGDRIDGNEAFRMGLVSKVLPHDELVPAAMELASRLAQGPTQSLSMIKYLVHRSLESSFRESLEMAHAALDVSRQTSDHKEAVAAFQEKRPPKFTGE